MDDIDSECDGCGAFLPLPDASGLVTCPACGRQKRVKPPTLGAPRPTDPMDPAPLASPPPMGDGWPAPPVVAPDPGADWTIPPGGGPRHAGGVTADGPSAGVKISGARALGCGCLPVLVTLLVMGAIGFVVFRTSDSVRKTIDGIVTLEDDKMALSGTATVLGSGDGGTIDLVAIVQDNDDGGSRTLSRLKLTDEGATITWDGPTIPTDAYAAEVAVAGDTLYAGFGDELWALDARTGDQRWSTTLSDKVTSGCDDCFAAVDGTLVVRTQDAVVAGYGDAASERLWSRRLTSAQGSVAVAGDSLVVVDDAATEGAGTVSVVAPATGKVARTVAPACRGGEGPFGTLVLGTGNVLEVVPGSTDLVAVFGFGDGCVVRFDPATGTTRFATRVPDVSSIDADSLVLSGTDLVFGTTSDALVHVDLTSGRFAVLERLADRRVEPARIVGRTLVADTVTSRGTPKGGLAAWDLGTNRRIWAVDLPGGSQPVSKSAFSRSSDTLFDGSPRTVLVPVGKGLRIFGFDGRARTVTVRSVDLATGDLAQVAQGPLETRYDSGTPSLTIEAITPTRLLFSVDHLLEARAANGEGGTSTFPKVD